MKRRNVIKGMIGVTAASGAGYFFANRYFDGYLSNPCLSGLPEAVKHSELWQKVWSNIDPTNVLDGHVHLVGTGDSSASGAAKPDVWVNPNLESWSHPWQHLQYQFYLNAACSELGEGYLDANSATTVDELYIARLRTLLADLPKGMKLALLAFDFNHTDAGLENREASTFFASNDYAQRVATTFPDNFEWAASIHPYRKDALEALEKALELGAVGVKWLPPAQNIDPADPRCREYYKMLARYGVPLICHTGIEKAVHSEDAQTYGNPLRLRMALDEGCKVVVSHCASLGDGKDFDNNDRPIAHFDLFCRLMEQSEYQGLLFGDISATTQLNRNPQVLKTLLSNPQWHERLVNCSDYPIPSVMPLISTKVLIREGLLDEKWYEPLNEIREYNAWLFDFALKRLLSFEGHQFSDAVFQSRSVYINS